MIMMPKCEEKDCNKTENLTECRIYGDETVIEKDIIYHFCTDHAYKNGFCYICGDFFGGIESFEFNNPSQLCENCLDDLKCELGEYDDEDCYDYNFGDI